MYIHIPFCSSKCPYCDFYSLKYSDAEADKYTKALTKRIESYKNLHVSSVYFGGGTPGIMGTQRIVALISTIKNTLLLENDAEVTLELNPESADKLDFAKLKKAGVNRLSIGLQSADRQELKYLGRLHSASLAEQTVTRAQKEGFDNISLDIMLGTSHQTKQSLKSTIDFCAALNVQHISAYILKIEENTPYHTHREKFVFPNEDEQAELYEFAVTELEKAGFYQYEISNFCKDGYYSRHNMLYWNCDEYIGIGPSAHSFFHGKRFYTPRSLEDFYNDKTVSDGDGGGEEEYAMLRLRLKKGLNEADYFNRFGKDIPKEYYTRASQIKEYANVYKDGISLTTKGFLLSNSIIAYLLYG
ncbi:MAG: radical SAM family heme chaperone HemW [Clostridiales bacterium]|nr:radical SAM family heme chaperone HemW [Clostridiales bacterium]